MSDSDSMEKTAQIITGFVNAVPVYEDALQPAARQIGTALETVAKAVNVALAPISTLVWGYEHIRVFVSNTVAQKLSGVPKEKIQTPDMTVAGPVLEALRYTGHKESLRDLYANLLANSIYTDNASSVHPGFVDIIRNLTCDEAKVLKLLSQKITYPIISLRGYIKNDKQNGFEHIVQNFSCLGYDSGCQRPLDTPIYIGNLCRLGLIRIPSPLHLADDKYAPIFNDPFYKGMSKNAENNPKFSRLEVSRNCVEVTEFGLQFSRACIYPPNSDAK